ncbi:MAG TPA: ankyrin repeat domain-containing protein [Steroidobacteraceae bacterium]|nr:ankyrin repeat domain-containing protein [Steroidobacteraceae bacterium]
MRRHWLALALICLATRAALGVEGVVDVPEKPAPLVEAVRAKDSVRAMELLAAHADVNQRTSDGTSALHWAVYNNDVALVDHLLAAHADPNAKNDYGSTPLSEAAVVGNAEVVRKLLKAGADVESPNRDGQTALMIVARTSNLDVAKLLLDHGAAVDAREQWRGQTALMWAAAEAQPEMVRLLIKHHADVNARSHLNNFERQVTAEPRMQARPPGGFTPLLYAARKGCVACAKYLVDGGADINLTDPEGVTPLLLATLNLNFDVAAFLIERGANVNKWDTWGRSPLYAAVDMNTLPVGGRADRPSSSRTTGLQLIKMLLDAGANPNLQLKLFPPYRSLRDDRGADSLLTVGTTALLRAAKAGDIEAMKLLLAHGANPNLPNERGITPLMAAAGNGSASLDTRGRYKTEAQSIEAVQLLLAAGVDINQRDGQGQTALHGAAQWGWNELIKTMVANNADVMVKDAHGRTAADIAMGNNALASGRAGSAAHPETAALLKQLMAKASLPIAENAPSAQ